MDVRSLLACPFPSMYSKPNLALNRCPNSGAALAIRAPIGALVAHRLRADGSHDLCRRWQAIRRRQRGLGQRVRELYVGLCPRDRQHSARRGAHGVCVAGLMLGDGLCGAQRALCARHDAQSGA